MPGHVCRQYKHDHSLEQTMENNGYNGKQWTKRLYRVDMFLVVIIKVLDVVLELVGDVGVAGHVGGENEVSDLLENTNHQRVWRTMNE